jgi:hypothetical protein
VCRIDPQSRASVPVHFTHQHLNIKKPDLGGGGGGGGAHPWGGSLWGSRRCWQSLGPLHHLWCNCGSSRSADGLPIFKSHLIPLYSQPV